MKEQQAETTLQQTISQSSSQVSQAFSTLQSSQQTYLSAKATADQTLQTVPTDVTKAQNALGTAVAALNTARAALTQTKAGIQLQIGVSQQALAQAQANANKAASDESRYHTLYLQGFVAAIDFDLAKTTASVDKSLAVAAQQNLELVKQKVAADLPTAQDQVVTAEQNVLAAEAALKAARSESFSVAAKLDDVRTAGKNVDASQANLKLIRANLQNVTLRQQDVKQDQDAVRQAQQQVDYEQAEFEKSLIRSPISGTVLTLSVQQGETLAAGLAAPTVIVVADLKRLEIDAYVDETDIGKVRLGQPAQVVVDAFPSQTLSGTVTKIYSGSTIQQGVVTYDVVISLEPEHLSLKPDMTATVTIETGNISNALVVPTVAVHNTVSGATINVLVNGSGGPSIKSIQVKTGGTDGVNTQILSGVKEGDTIVVAGTGLSTTKKGPSGPSNPFGPATPRAGGGGGGRAGG
jgi:RND family efflux transporter MFP subunit